LRRDRLHAYIPVFLSRSIGAPASKEPEFSVENVKPWPVDFPRVYAHTSVGMVLRHEAHGAGKCGDIHAARILVGDVIKVDRIRALAGLYPGAIVVPIRALEESGKNAIPWAYAEVFAAIGAFEVDTEIVQTNVTSHTGRDGISRLLIRARFGGRVREEGTYIVVDDIVTQGGTVSELRHHIENHGGRVAAISSLAFSRYSNVVGIRLETIGRLESKFGRYKLEEFLKENDISGTIEALTESEARELLLFSTLERIRDRIVEAGGGRIPAGRHSLFQRALRTKIASSISSSGVLRPGSF